MKKVSENEFYNCVISKPPRIDNFWIFYQVPNTSQNHTLDTFFSLQVSSFFFLVQIFTNSYLYQNVVRIDYLNAISLSSVLVLKGHACDITNVIFIKCLVKFDVFNYKRQSDFLSLSLSLSLSHTHTHTHTHTHIYIHVCGLVSWVVCFTASQFLEFFLKPKPAFFGGQKIRCS